MRTKITWTSYQILRAGALVSLLALIVAACGDTASTPEAAQPTPLVAEAPAAASAESETAPASSTSVAPQPAATAPPPAAAPEEATATSLSLPGPTTVPLGCLHGWVTPEPGTALRSDPLDLMRRDMGLSDADLFVVEEMRYFVGPEDANVIAPRRDVERWYVKAFLQDDASFAGRWLVRRAGAVEGVMAVAPHDSIGFEPGSWLSFVGESDGPSAYPGVPGRWWGVAEDPFTPACDAGGGPYCTCDWGVGGCACDPPGNPICTGIPPEVMGCLADG